MRLTRIIEEMVALCREFLISDVSGDELVDAIVILEGSVCTGLRGGHGEVTDQLVEYIREEFPRCPPGSHKASYALAKILALRSIMNALTGDSQEAIALFNKIAASQPFRDETNPSRSDGLLGVATVASTLFTLYPNLENLEEAMSCVCTAGADSSLEDNTQLTRDLERLIKARVECFDLAEHAQSVSSGPAQETASLSLQQMSTPDERWIGWDVTWDVREACSMTTIEYPIQLLQDLIPSALPGTVGQRKYLEALADWYAVRFTDVKSGAWRVVDSMVSRTPYRERVYCTTLKAIDT